MARTKSSTTKSSTKSSTKSAPITCHAAWLALGGASEYAKGSENVSDPARNRQLWSLNERGFLMLTPDAQALVDAYKVTPAKKAAKVADPVAALAGLDPEVLAALAALLGK